MATRRRADSAVATGRGDDGSTGLLFGGDRIPKDDLRTEAYGTIDEAVAALGLARAQLNLKAERDGLSPGLSDLAAIILRLQRELFVAASELATNQDAWDRLLDGTTRVSREMVDGIDALLAEAESRVEMPREFVVPGETRASADLELARTLLRRAERRTVTLAREDTAIAEGHTLPYLNRLADLLWILARAAEQAESRTAVVARPDRRRGEPLDPSPEGAGAPA
jgi:cob(I)alamin adenosyltransferase